MHSLMSKSYFQTLKKHFWYIFDVKILKYEGQSKFYVLSANKNSNLVCFIEVNQVGSLLVDRKTLKNNKQTKLQVDHIFSRYFFFKLVKKNLQHSADFYR